MKKITMFTMASCPYCRMAHRWMDQVLESNPEFKQIELEIIDEVKYPHIADKYNYWFVPTYYVDGEKVHEGAAGKKTIERVFQKAME